MKNIPLSRKESYIYKLIDKTEQLLKPGKHYFTTMITPVIGKRINQKITGTVSLWNQENDHLR